MKFFFFILVFHIVLKGYPAIIEVPSDQPSIQAAIDAAQRGDTVLIAQ